MSGSPRMMFRVWYVKICPHMLCVGEKRSIHELSLVKLSPGLFPLAMAITAETGKRKGQKLEELRRSSSAKVSFEL